MSYDNLQSRLYRSNGLIGGVCAGLGERFAVDPIFVRIVLILSVLCAGVGIFAYLVYWAVVPHKDDVILEPLPSPAPGSRPFWRTRAQKLAGFAAVLRAPGTSTLHSYALAPLRLQRELRPPLARLCRRHHRHAVGRRAPASTTTFQPL